MFQRKRSRYRPLTYTHRRSWLFLLAPPLRGDTTVVEAHNHMLPLYFTQDSVKNNDWEYRLWISWSCILSLIHLRWTVLILCWSRAEAGGCSVELWGFLHLRRFEHLCFIDSDFWLLVVSGGFFVSRRFASRMHEISDLKKALELSLRAECARLKDKKNILSTRGTRNGNGFRSLSRGKGQISSW